MSPEPTDKERIHDAMLEALLQQALRPSDGDQAAVRSLIAKIDSLEVEDSASHEAPSSPLANATDANATTRHSRRWIVWLSTAAALVIGILLLNSLNSSQSAQASLQKVLQAKSRFRTYTIEMTHQLPIWGQREVSATLYLDDHDQFVFEHPGWKNLGKVWIGGDGEQRWIVPPRGPALAGREAVVARWLDRKDLPSPFLHMNTILNRMRRSYDLSQLPNVTSPCEPKQLKVECLHLKGESNRKDPRLPESIEVWADAETGIAHQVQLNWHRDKSERGPVAWTIKLVSYDDLPADWFNVESHLRFARPVIKLQTTNDLDALESDEN